jgi:predicted nuclease of predicted toxin-antitoxin system
MKILIDMNLSPNWTPVFDAAGIESIHWSNVGKHDAPDNEIMKYAEKRGYIIFTHDLDFGDILAATGAESPSVIQVRTQNPVPDMIGTHLLSAIQKFQSYLVEGALITVDLSRSRARILPLE